MKISILGLLLSLNAFAANNTHAFFPLQPTDRLSTPWMQELYNRSLAAKATARPQGICQAAQALYTVKIENDQSNGMEYFTTMMEAVKTAMSTQTDRFTRLYAIVAAKADGTNKESVEKFVGKAIPDSGISQLILDHSSEFAGSTPSKILLHSDAVYKRRESTETPMQESFLSFLGVLDLEKKELSIIGNGDCPF